MIFSEEHCQGEIAAILFRWHQITRDLERPAPLWDYRLLIHIDLWNSFIAHGEARRFSAPGADLAEGITKFYGISILVNPNVEAWQLLPLNEIAEEFIAAHARWPNPS